MPVPVKPATYISYEGLQLHLKVSAFYDIVPFDLLLKTVNNLIIKVSGI